MNYNDTRAEQGAQFGDLVLVQTKEDNCDNVWCGIVLYSCIVKYILVLTICGW